MGDMDESTNPREGMAGEFPGRKERPSSAEEVEREGSPDFGSTLRAVGQPVEGVEREDSPHPEETPTHPVPPPGASNGEGVSAFRQTAGGPGEAPGEPQAPKETFGAYLRRHREARGITIEQLAATTKIKDRILAALEEDRYDETPPLPLVRGFVKNIAVELKLRPSEALSHFDEMGIKKEAEKVFPEWSADLKAPRRNYRSLVPALAVLFVVAGVVFLFYADEWNWRWAERAPTPVEKKEEPARPAALEPEKTKETRALASHGRIGSGPPSPAEPPQAAPPKRSDDAPANPTGPQAVRATAMNGAESDRSKAPGESGVEVSVKKTGRPDSKPLVLKITAEEDTWLRVFVDGKQRDEIFLLEGESRQWAGEKTFVLTVGNASNTRVELNGLAIRLPKTKSNLVRDFLISKKNLP